MPLRDKKNYLWDILGSAKAILDYAEGKTLEDYQTEAMFRRAVERELTIIGEAFTQARQFFPDSVDGISNIKQIIAFRNFLIHAYINVSDDIVWGIVLDDIPLLITEVEARLKVLEAENEN